MNFRDQGDDVFYLTTLSLPMYEQTIEKTNTLFFFIFWGGGDEDLPCIGRISSRMYTTPPCLATAQASSGVPARE